jgi:hypothetical protein
MDHAGGRIVWVRQGQTKKEKSFHNRIGLDMAKIMQIVQLWYRHLLTASSRFTNTRIRFLM